MIKQVHIENFKCFSRPTHIDLAEITVCAGMNSVGKSSLIQALLLLRQSFEAMEKYRGGTDDTYSVLLNHSYDLHLGSVDQIRSSRDTNVIYLFSPRAGRH